jgi:hypothetical protein
MVSAPSKKDSKAPEQEDNFQLAKLFNNVDGFNAKALTIEEGKIGKSVFSGLNANEQITDKLKEFNDIAKLQRKEESEAKPK